MRHRTILGALALASATLLAAAPEASAQHRGPRGRGVVRAPAVRIYGGGYWPYYWGGFYDVWGPWYGYPSFYGPRYVDYGNSAALRLQVKPKQTEVFVDGYLAGTVDDFDGAFQRLRVEPGNHTLELYLDGYHLVRQELHLGPGASFKVKHEMAPLAAGEAADPRPVPPLDAPRAEAAPSAPERDAVAPEGFGVLLLRVQPAEAEVWVDGEHWPAEAGGELSLHLSAGHHRVELRQAGHEPFKAQVEIRAGQSSRLDVRLPRVGASA